MHSDLRRRIDEAAAQHERARKALSRPDGQPRYGPAESTELEEVARREFEDKLRRLEDEVDGRLASAEEKLHTMEHSDPSAALTAAELEQANARREFISDEVFGHTAQGLEDRVRAVIASGDSAAMFLYAHFIRARASDSSAGAEGLVPDPEQLRLKQLADELENALNPGAAGRQEKARAEIDELGKIKDYAFYRRHGVRDAVEMHMQRAYGA
jgi:hypothetical protein